MDERIVPNATSLDGQEPKPVLPPAQVAPVVPETPVVPEAPVAPPTITPEQGDAEIAELQKLIEQLKKQREGFVKERDAWKDKLNIQSIAVDAANKVLKSADESLVAATKALEDFDAANDPNNNDANYRKQRQVLSDKVLFASGQVAAATAGLAAQRSILANIQQRIDFYAALIKQVDDTIDAIQKRIEQIAAAIYLKKPIPAPGVIPPVTVPVIPGFDDFSKPLPAKPTPVK